MTQLDATLTPEELLAAWRPDTLRLTVPVEAPPRLGQRAALRLRLAGIGARSTVVGAVASVHALGRRHRVELAPEEAGLRAVRFLLAAARGEHRALQERAPRFLVRLPVVVATESGEQLMTTWSVSEGGCGLSWSGPPPAVGRQLRLRLGPRARASDVWGVVCWSAPAGRSATAGLRLASSDPVPPAWQELLAEAARRGAPRA
jgi:hypothetical protein